MSQSSNGCIRTLANNLRELRFNTGETQEAVAERAGLSYRNYQSIESGKGNPAIKTLDALALHFKVTVSNLFRLSAIRVGDGDELILKLKQNLIESENAVFIRDLDGLILWGNKKMTLETSINAESKPINLLTLLSEPCQNIFRVQMEAQRRVYAQPAITAHPTGNKNSFIRYYPVLVYLKRERYPTLALVYAVSTAEDCEAHYYNFCNELLDLL